MVPNITKDNHAFIFMGHGVKEDEGTRVLLKHSVTSLQESKKIFKENLLLFQDMSSAVCLEIFFEEMDAA
jgi:hypothetical protein